MDCVREKRAESAGLPPSMGNLPGSAVDKRYSLDAMRLTTVNPLPFQPRTSLERELCSKVATASGEVVLNVWTPESYPYEDLQGNRVALSADYEIQTGRLTNGLFASGSVYHGFLRDGKVEVELDETWNS